MGIDRRLEEGERLKTNEEGKRAAAPGWIAAQSGDLCEVRRTAVVP
jgi:hypothetical protein